MKIAFLGPAPPFRGGISQFAVQLGTELSLSGHEVRYFNFIQQFPPILFPGGSQMDEKAQECRSERVLTPYNPITWFKTIDAINSWQADKVIVSWWLPFFAIPFGFILRRLKCTSKIVLAHNVIPHENWPGTKLLLRYVFASADSIVVLSKACMQDLKSILPSREVNKARLGFHPLYNVLGSTAKIPSNEPRILFFGLIKPYKGLLILLQALQIAVKTYPHIQLTIAGAVYGKIEVYETEIERLNLRENVKTEFRYISEDEIGDFFRHTDVCILPYLTATQSGVIATAYSYDTPVIASDVGGLGEYIRNGETGLLVAPQNPELLARAIVHFFEKHLAETMQPNIGQLKQENSWSELAKIVLK